MSTAIKLRCTPGGRSAFDSLDKMFAPLFQQSVGFDHLFDTMNRALRESGNAGSYPPYDILQRGRDEYSIRIALAGFGSEDIEVKLDNGVLSVTGTKEREELSDETAVLHRGIANRNFSRRFRLTEHIRVEGAELKDGLLTVRLVRELPEALKPRTIPVNVAA